MSHWSLVLLVVYSLRLLATPQNELEKGNYIIKDVAEKLLHCVLWV